MAVSTALLGCLNALTLCISLPVLLVGYFLKLTANSPCDPVMYKPLLALGLCLLIVSLIGFLGACCRITVFLWLYLIALFIVIIGLLACLSVGGAIIKGGENGEDVLGGGVKEYELHTFSGWLKSHLVGGSHWEDVKACMIHHDACGKIGAFRSIMDFVSLKTSKLTSIETGCCKPPVHCGFEYENSTNWKVPEKGLSSQDQDCKTWNNDSAKLCYNCGSCKAGYLALFMKGWRKITIVQSVLLIILFIIFIIACCALRD
ncbi:Tetraspanin-9 [Bienertia sinuspersici]